MRAFITIAAILMNLGVLRQRADCHSTRAGAGVDMVFYAVAYGSHRVERGDAFQLQSLRWHRRTIPLRLPLRPQPILTLPMRLRRAARA